MFVVSCFVDVARVCVIKLCKVFILLLFIYFLVLYDETNPHITTRARFTHFKREKDLSRGQIQIYLQSIHTHTHNTKEN